MPSSCCIVGCGHTCGPQDTAHQLPSKDKKRNKWMAVFELNQIELCTKAKIPVICQCHFNEDQFTYNNKKKCLKPDAIPVNFNLFNEKRLKSKEWAELRNMKKDYESLTSGLLKFMTENQILHIISGDPDLEFDNQTIIKALEILQKSNQRTYEFIYSLGYPLPSYKTLKKKIQTLNLESEESQQLMANKTDLIEDKSSRKRVSKPLKTIKPKLIISNKNSINNNQNIKVSKVIKIKIEKQNDNNLINNNNNSISDNTQNPIFNSVISYEFICDTNGCSFSTNYKPSLEEHKRLHINGSEVITQKDIKTTASDVLINEDQSESVSDNSDNSKSQTNKNKRLETTIDTVFDESEDNKDFSMELKSSKKQVFESIKSFYCGFPNCYSNYETLDQLEQHISDCHLNYQFLDCVECDLRFESQTQLNKHNSDCHSVTTSKTKDLAVIVIKKQEEKPKTSNPTQLSCKFANCERVFNSKLRLISHLLKFHSKKRLKCNLCEFETKLISHLKRHQNKEHSKQINRKILNINHFICSVCNETFHSEHVLTKHRNSVHKELALHCNYCEFKAQTNDEFIKHKLIHTNERKQYSCDECKDRFTTQSLLDSHKHNIHILKAKNFEVLKCDLCVYKTRDRNKWEIHQRRHRGENPYLCSIDGCDKSFKYEISLEVHQNRDHFKDNPYKCDKCDEAFPGKQLLYRHKDRDHCERTFDCDSCNYKTICKDRLSRHQLIHSNVSPLICGINGCEKWFTYKKYLQIHQNRVHFKNLKKNFVCDWPECGLRFEAKSKLNSHVLRHRNERPVTCDWPECEASFVDKSALSGHRKTHLKPYKCPSSGCKLTFSLKSDWVKHYKSKHD